MVAHHVGRPPRGPVGTGGVGHVGAVLAATDGFLDKTIQPAAIDVRGRVDLLVRAATVEILVVEIGLDTLMGQGIRDADGGDAIRHGNAVGAGVGSNSSCRTSDSPA